MRYTGNVMRRPVIIITALAAAAVLTWPMELWAIGQTVTDTVIESYVVRFVDAATWAFGCL